MTKIPGGVRRGRLKSSLEGSSFGYRGSSSCWSAGRSAERTSADAPEVAAASAPSEAEGCSAALTSLVSSKLCDSMTLKHFSMTSTTSTKVSRSRVHTMDVKTGCVEEQKLDVKRKLSSRKWRQKFELQMSAKMCQNNIKIQ